MPKKWRAFLNLKRRGLLIAPSWRSPTPILGNLLFALIIPRSPRCETTSMSRFQSPTPRAISPGCQSRRCRGPASSSTSLWCSPMARSTRSPLHWPRICRPWFPFSPADSRYRPRPNITHARDAGVTQEWAAGRTALGKPRELHDIFKADEISINYTSLCGCPAGRRTICCDNFMDRSHHLNAANFEPDTIRAPFLEQVH